MKRNPKTVGQWLRGGLLGIAVLSVSAAGLADVALPQLQHVEIRGSMAMGAVARLVAERYMHEHPDAVVTVAGGGTRRGLKSLVVGTAQIALGTDAVPEDVQALAERAKVKIEGHPVFSDAVAVVVHPKNPVSNLSLRDLRDIFRGKIVDWKEVGRDSNEGGRSATADGGAQDPSRPVRQGKLRGRESGTREVHLAAPRDAGAPREAAGPSSQSDGERGPIGDIEVVTFGATEGPYETFKKEVLGEDSVITPRAREVSFGAFHAAITEKAIGYIGIHGAHDLKVLTVDGELGTAENVRKHRYPIRRELWIYVREDASKPVTSVVDYFLDPNVGQKIAEALGNVPVK